MKRPFLRANALAFAALVGLSACGGGEKTEASDAGAASADSKQPTLGGKLGAAVAAAEASAARGPRARGPAGGPAGAGSGSVGADGPPETGVFPPGRADHEAPTNGAPKMEVFSEGGEPRVQLSYDKFEDQKIPLTLSVRAGPQSPTLAVALDLVCKPQKKGDKKDEGKKEEGKKDKKDKDKKDKAAEPEVDGTRIALKIESAKLDADQGPQGASVPKELGEAIAKMKGGELRFVLTPDGRVANLSAALAKEVADLDIVPRTLGEAISTSIAPLPKKPVGVGGTWMVSDRAVTTQGLDVVRYRVFKVDKIDGQKAILSIETREYAASGDLDLGPRGKGSVYHFESQGKGTLALTGGLPVPLEMTQRMQAVVGPGGLPAGQEPAQGQQQMIFFQFGAKSR